MKEGKPINSLPPWATEAGTAIAGLSYRYVSRLIDREAQAPVAKMDCLITAPGFFVVPREISTLDMRESLCAQRRAFI